MKVENVKRFSLKMLFCEARAFPVCTAYGYTISRPFFYSAANAHAYESGHVASGVETFIVASSIIGHWQ